MTRLYSKRDQFYKFWPFSKNSLKLSASTPPSYLVVIVLLGMNRIQLMSHFLIRSSFDIACDIACDKTQQQIGQFYILFVIFKDQFDTVSLFSPKLFGG